MKKFVYFKIQTSYGMETYICEVENNDRIELQCEDFLAKWCYCDAYEFVSYRDCTDVESVLMREALKHNEDEWEAQFEVKDVSKY